MGNPRRPNGGGPAATRRRGGAVLARPRALTINAAQVRADLSRAIGKARVRWNEPTLLEHSHDSWPLALLQLQQQRLDARPACVAKPATVEQVVRVVRYAGEHAIPLVPFGAGSGVCGGVLPPAGAIVIDLRGLNRLLELNETALVCRVQAGMMGDRCEVALNARGYTTGHFPQSIGLSTVGGWVATRAAGQFSTRYGSIEDAVLGLEAVLADGRIVRINPVPRRSAGPDLRQLFLGSEGTLGVITEVALRVFPVPESRRLMCFAFPDMQSGFEAARAILRAGWRPPVLRLYDAVETARHFGQWAADDACFLLVVSEGPLALTAAEMDACRAACVSFHGQVTGDQPVQHWLVERNHVPSVASFVERGFVLDTIEVAAGWDRVHDLYREVLAAVGTVKGLVVVSGHTSHAYTTGTNIYFTFVAQPESPAQAEAVYLACWEKAMAATLRCGGTISHHHGIGRMRRRWMAAEHGEGLAVLRAVKQALDPQGLMNPGVLLPEGD